MLSVSLYGVNYAGLSDYRNRGSWTVPGPLNHPSIAVSVTPASGNGSTNVFSFLYSDADGSADINSAFVGFLPQAFGSSCYVYYVRAAKSLMLLEESGKGWSSPLTPGVPGTAQNSQCTLNARASWSVESGTQLVLNLAFTFKAGSGVLNTYLYACDNRGGNSDWHILGNPTAP